MTNYRMLYNNRTCCFVIYKNNTIKKRLKLILTLLLMITIYRFLILVQILTTKIHILLYIYFDMYNKFKYHSVKKPFF